MSPLGSPGGLVYTIVPSPPAAITGVNVVKALSSVKVITLEVDAVALNAGGFFTYNSKDLLLVLFALSVAVTVNVAVFNNSVGLPVISPLTLLKLSPAGKKLVVVLKLKVVPPAP